MPARCQLRLDRLGDLDYVQPRVPSPYQSAHADFQPRSPAESPIAYTPSSRWHTSQVRSLSEVSRWKNGRGVFNPFTSIVTEKNWFLVRRLKTHGPSLRARDRHPSKQPTGPALLWPQCHLDERASWSSSWPRYGQSREGVDLGARAPCARLTLSSATAGGASHQAGNTLRLARLARHSRGEVGFPSPCGLVGSGTARASGSWTRDAFLLMRRPELSVYCERVKSSLSPTPEADPMLTPKTPDKRRHHPDTPVDRLSTRQRSSHTSSRSMAADRAIQLDQALTGSTMERTAMFDRYDPRSDDGRDRGDSWDRSFGSRGSAGERDRDERST